VTDYFPQWLDVPAAKHLSPTPFERKLGQLSLHKIITTESLLQPSLEASQGSAQRAMWKLGKLYGGAFPDKWDRDSHALINNAGNEINNAVSQCYSLDLLRAANGETPQHLSALADLDSPASLKEIHALALVNLKIQRLENSPLLVAQRAGDKRAVVVKGMMHQLRQLGRDGHSINGALASLARTNGEHILTELKEGRGFQLLEGIVVALRDVISHPERFQTRPLTETLRSLWLALRLWECRPNGHEALQRYNAFQMLYERPLIPASEGAFYTAWVNLRTKQLKPARLTYDRLAARS